MAKTVFHASIEGAQHGAKTLEEFIIFAKNSGATGAEPSNYHIENIEVISNFLSKIKIKTPNGLLKFQVSTSFEHQYINIIISLIIFKYNKLKIEGLLSRTKNIVFVEGRGLFHELKIKKK